MNMFGINIVLAFCWAALSGSFSFVTLVTGYVLGFGALWIAQPIFGHGSPYYLRSIRVVRLILYFLYDLAVSSVRVAIEVLRPHGRTKPEILEMPLDAKSDIEILLVTNLISLTPGTLSLDVSPDRSTLYVHAMFADDPEALVAELKSGIERLVVEVFADR